MSDTLSFDTRMEFAYGEPAPVRPGIVRIVARNPSPFTFKGTNTYLVGTTELAVIDPGPDDRAHIDAILAAAGSRPVTHILISHAHRDHIDGALALKERTGATTYAYGRDGAPPQGPEPSPSGKVFVNYDFAPDVRLGGGQSVAGADWRLEAIHTPGHAPDHLCFALADRRVLFSGDHVMGWNTTVIAPPEGRMADYYASLELLLGRNDVLFLPGHGERLEDPIRTVKAYLIHRRVREDAILDCIRDGRRTIRTIVPAVYQGISDSLLPAASLSVLAHVEHLIERGLVRSAGSPVWSHDLWPA